MGLLNIGVVGYGMRGGEQVPVDEYALGSRLAAVADVRLPALEQVRARHGDRVRTVRDYRELLALDLDALVIATPDDTHEQIAIDALRAGLPVFVEKPLAITTEGADRVLAAARASGTKLYVGHNMRFTTVFVEMRRLIAEGAIGKVQTIWCRHFVGHGGDYYFADWHADRRRVTSLLLQKASHDLDVIHWLAGSYTRRVQAMGSLMVYGDVTDRRVPGDQLMQEWWDPERRWPPRALTGLNPIIDVEDVSLVNMTLENGVLAAYQQCHFTPDYWRNFTVIGDEGRIENFGDGGGSGGVLRVWNRRSDYRADADLEVVVPPEGGTHGGDDERIWSEFVRFVRDDGPITVSPIGAREAVAVGVSATRSLRDGGSTQEIMPPPADVVNYFEPGRDTEARA